MTPAAIAAARAVCEEMQSRYARFGAPGTADAMDAKDALLVALAAVERLTVELRNETAAKVHARERQAPVNETLRVALIRVIDMCDPAWFDFGEEIALRKLAQEAARD